MLLAVIFDLDGTLVDFNLDIKRIKREIFGFNAEQPLLEMIATLAPERREEALAKVVEHEVRAAKQAELKHGVMEVLHGLRSRGIALALATRNCRRAWEIIAERHRLAFDAVVTREDAEPKPSPAQFLLALRQMGVSPEHALAVGDHAFDYLAARGAGVRIALLNTRFASEYLDKADFVLHRIEELEQVVADLCG